MASTNPGFHASRIANADLSTKQYYAMKLIAGQKVDLADGTADQVIGFLQNKPTSGKNAEVAIGPSGTCKAIAGGAITEGVLVKVNASGKVIAGGAGSDVNYGIAFSAATADGDIIEVLPFAQKLVT